MRLTFINMNASFKKRPAKGSCKKSSESKIRRNSRKYTLVQKLTSDLLKRVSRNHLKEKNPRMDVSKEKNSTYKEKHSRIATSEGSNKENFLSSHCVDKSRRLFSKITRNSNALNSTWQGSLRSRSFILN